MRFRLVVLTLAVCWILVLACPLTVQAQTQILDQRNAFWEGRAIIGLPGDEDDEGDDEGEDCPPYPAMVATTQQTTSYEIGDDGYHQAGVSVNPRFTVHGNGTVTDNLTGLVWLQDAGCFGIQTWSGALWDAENLANGSCGLNDGSLPGDWRMPNIRELLSLVDFGQTGPALPPEVPFTGVYSSYYWSSTTFANAPSAAWYLNLSVGRVRCDPKTYSYYVWPVRGPE